MTILTEGLPNIAFLVSEANGYRSREQVVIVTGQNLAGGAVVGKITASGKYAVYNNAAVDGTQTAAGILMYAKDATAADKAGVIIARDAEVNEGELVYAAGTSAGDKTAAKVELVAAGIIVRAN